MKLPRFHFAIRTMMIAVATVAVMLAAGISAQRIIQRRALLRQKMAGDGRLPRTDAPEIPTRRFPSMAVCWA